MIPNNITEEHIELAIDYIDKNGVPENRDSTEYNLLYLNNYYPPKYVLSLANKYANGVELNPKGFNGGTETNNFLNNLGFEIVKNKNNSKRRKIIFEVFQNLLMNDEEVIIEYIGKITRMRFYPKSFEWIPSVGDGTWDGTDKVILYEIENRKDRLDLLLVIGPSDDPIRRDLYNIACESPELFSSSVKGNLSDQYKRVFSCTLMNESEVYELTENELRERVKNLYNQFREDEYTNIEMYINSYKHDMIGDKKFIDVSVITETEREIIGKTRVGHSLLRGRLLNDGRDHCEICGLKNERLLIMSHIKPWSKSTNEERLNDNNVLMLCPNHDKLFDVGLISFDETGKIMFSSDLTDDVKCLMNIDDDTSIDLPTKREFFMKWHRKNMCK